MNSDLRMLREFGESRLPPADEPPAELRRRVLTSVLPERARRTRLPYRPLGVRPAWRFAAVGVTAAAVAAAMFVGQPGHRAGTAPPPAAAGATPEAVRILQLAAYQVSAAPAPAARPDQFVFVESVDSILHIRDLEPGKDPNRAHLATATLEPHLSRRWLSVDGTQGVVARYLPWRSAPAPAEQTGASPGCRDGRQVIDPAKPDVTKACTPHPAVRADLPTDAEAMLRYLYRPGDDGAGGPNVPADQKAFQRASDIIEASLSAPAVQAAVFRAVAQIADVTVTPGTVDAAGRRGVAVTRTGGPYRFELIFDTKTHRYLGSSWDIIDLTTALPGLIIRGMKPGDPTTQTAILRVAIVDKADQLP
jgi:hypothetical protein